MENIQNKNEYAKVVSLFLAELIRSRKVMLRGAADIAEKVVMNINLIDTEQQFLNLIKELSVDFEELHPLSERMHVHIKTIERKDMEQQVKSFVSNIMPTNMDLALDVLKEAAKDQVKLSELCQKFPEFKQFIETHK